MNNTTIIERQPNQFIYRGALYWLAFSNSAIMFFCPHMKK